MKTIFLYSIDCNDTLKNKALCEKIEELKNKTQSKIKFEKISLDDMLIFLKQNNINIPVNYTEFFIIIYDNQIIDGIMGDEINILKLERFFKETLLKILKIKNNEIS
jgi:hypothetical protein